MSAGPEFMRSIMAKQGLPRKVWALWSDWKLELVSSYQFGGSLPCAGVCCTVGKQKAHGKEGLRKRIRLPRGVSVRWRCGGTRTQSAFKNDVFDNRASKMGFQCYKRTSGKAPE